MINITPVILCGRSGSHLWRLSLTDFPMHFLCLTAEESLVNQAAFRPASFDKADVKVVPTVMVTGKDHGIPAFGQLREIGVELGCALLNLQRRNAARTLALAVVAAWLKVLDQSHLNILQAAQAAWGERSADHKLVRPVETKFSIISSVGYTPMDYCPSSSFPIMMDSLDAGGNDTGAWDVVWNVLPKDDAGSAHLGDVLTTDSKNTLTHATGRLANPIDVASLSWLKCPMLFSWTTKLAVRRQTQRHPAARMDRADWHRRDHQRRQGSGLDR